MSLPPDPTPASPLQTGPAIPILRVEDLEASVRYYLNRLGFRVDWQGAGILAQVSRGACRLMLAEGDQGHAGGWVYVSVSDADALHQELLALGATVRLAPVNYPWGRELHILDPDGNVLRFGSDVVPGEPLGTWLDMRGILWEMSASGWTRATHE